MQIKDINGLSITVTDLQASIDQAATFKTFEHAEKSFKDFDAKQKVYWTDIHNKLLSLKK